LLLVLHGSDLP